MAESNADGWTVQAKETGHTRLALRPLHTAPAEADAKKKTGTCGDRASVRWAALRGTVKRGVLL